MTHSRARFSVPLDAAQHRVLALGVLLVLAFAVLVGGRAAWPLAIAAGLVSLGAHLGVLGALVLALGGVLGWITRVARLLDVERLLDAAALERGVALLDVGCGDGLVGIRAARRGARVIAVDDPARGHGRRRFSEGVVRANARAEGVDGPLEVRSAPLDALGLADASVDVAIACFSLHSLPAERRGRAVRELVRVVRPGGRIWLAEPFHREELADHLRAEGALDVRHHARTFPRALFGWVSAARP